MTPQSALALAVAAAFLVGAVAGLLAFDGLVFWLSGHTATVSHGMWALGETYRWLPWVWTVAGCGVVVGLRIHFWAR